MTFVKREERLGFINNKLHVLYYPFKGGVQAPVANSR